MKKTFLYVAVGIFTFLISLGTALYFVQRPDYDLATSRNVCQKCLDVSKTEFIETKALSEIVNDKDFQGKKVRVKARFRHDAGYIFLEDKGNKNISISVGFDKNAIPCQDTEKTLQICSGYKTWYDHSVEVIVVGYLGKISEESNQFQGGEDGFNIYCVEQVNPTEEELKIGITKFENNPFTIFGW